MPFKLTADIIFSFISKKIRHDISCESSAYKKIWPDISCESDDLPGILNLIFLEVYMYIKKKMSSSAVSWRSKKYIKKTNGCKKHMS